MMKSLGAAVAVAALASMAVPAAAQQINFIGSTDGSFGAGSPGNSASLGGLAFLDSTFNVTTSNGFVGIGAMATVPNVDNLGSFSLSGSPFNYTGAIFNLLVSFTAPAGTAPGNTLITSNLTGSVTANDIGGVEIDFDNSLRNFTFNGGSFNFRVADVNVTAGAPPVAITGNIRAVPGPIAGAGLPVLMALGGFVWLRRRYATKVA